MENVFKDEYKEAGYTVNDKFFMVCKEFFRKL